jgi:nitroimidazol reductase NimA-like FMN-containing flavoprotein (pyridoxamine 5'-phosphate oxidase superfamily)
MFRELRRKNKALGKAECIEILKTEKRGVLSVNGDGGYPYGMPMNHFYNEEDGCIYFHSGRGGHRNDSVLKNEKASFCVFDKGSKKENDWALTFRSVIVFGRIEIIDDKSIVSDISRKLCYKFTDDEKYISEEIERFAAATILLKLTPLHITGKQIEEK